MRASTLRSLVCACFVCSYDVSPDGKFVINSLSDDYTSLILVVNWTASLK